MFKTESLAESVRALDADEIDLVSGGITGGCIPTKTIRGGEVPPDWEFKDVFAHYVIGRYTPVA